VSWYFSELQKGSTPTLLQASFANKVLKALNALGNITIAPDSDDRVEYSDEGVYIYYKNTAQDLTTEISMIDPSDITKMVTITIENGMITAVTEGESGYTTKSVEVCEGDNIATHDFVIKK
jgi:hypothetical protein